MARPPFRTLSAAILYVIRYQIGQTNWTVDDVAYFIWNTYRPLYRFGGRYHRSERITDRLRDMEELGLLKSVSNPEHGESIWSLGPGWPQAGALAIEPGTGGFDGGDTRQARGGRGSGGDGPGGGDGDGDGEGGGKGGGLGQVLAHPTLFSLPPGELGPAVLRAMGETL